MKKFLVGGAVRDLILGREIKDFDYVIFNCSEQSLIDQGFQLIKKDIKVFLDPKTGHQYAFPRKEIKVGDKYTDFIFDYNNVSLAEDLYRRDFTINAMARDEDTGVVIDPYNGQLDLKNKILRHVSDKFSEDPLRVIRGFRFMSNFGLTIAPDTLKLFESLKDDLNHISNGRIILELSKVNDLYTFFSLLEKYGFLDVVFKNAKIVSGFYKLDIENCLLYLYNDSKILNKEVLCYYGFRKSAVESTTLLVNYDLNFKILFKKLKVDKSEYNFNLLKSLFIFRCKDFSKLEMAIREIKSLEFNDLIQKYSGKELGNQILLRKEAVYKRLVK